MAQRARAAAYAVRVAPLAACQAMHRTFRSVKQRLDHTWFVRAEFVCDAVRWRAGTERWSAQSLACQLVQQQESTPENHCFCSGCRSATVTAECACRHAHASGWVCLCGCAAAQRTAAGFVAPALQQQRRRLGRSQPVRHGDAGAAAPAPPHLLGFGRVRVKGLAIFKERGKGGREHCPRVISSGILPLHACLLVPPVAERSSGPLPATWSPEGLTEHARRAASTWPW